MSAVLKNLSSYDPEKIPDAQHFSFGVVVAEWNLEITGALLGGTVETLIKHGTHERNIHVIHVPGTFELTYGAKLIAETNKTDAIIVLGCVIQGETRHFDFICQGVTQGITSLNTILNIPVIFGVLTTDNYQQAKDRAGGIHGNKGVEAAVTAIKMADLQKKIKYF